MNSAQAISDFEALRRNADLMVDLKSRFFETDDYLRLKQRVFNVLSMRASQLKAGQSELKGAALIGPPGIGKTRMVEKIAADYGALVEATGGCEFGSKVFSVTVPGRATVRETCLEILREIGYDIVASRDEGYLFERVVGQLEKHKIAALHLDEVQDSGRYTTSDSMKQFTGKMRNFMQKRSWPVCIIITGTLEAKKIINQDGALVRRLRPVEVMPMVLEKEGLIMQRAIKEMLSDTGLSHDGLLNETEFLRMLMHAAAYRFGMAIETAIEAIGLAKLDGDLEITIDHFAEAYFVRMNCDDESNPFIARLWKTIDTTIAMDRFVSDDKERRKKLPRD
jgi:hypothetical protein